MQLRTRCPFARNARLEHRVPRDRLPLPPTLARQVMPLADIKALFADGGPPVLGGLGK